MKIKILIIILFAFVMSIDCSAKSKHPDEIQDSIMYNGTVYKIVRMWRKNSKGAYNPSLMVLAKDQMILYIEHGWTATLSFVKIDGHLFIREYLYHAHIYNSQGKEIQPNIKYPDFAGIKNFEDIEKPLICFSSDYFGKEYFSLDGELLIPIHTKVDTFFVGQRKFYHISDYKTQGLMDENLKFIFPVKEKQKIVFEEESPFFICYDGNTSIYNSSTDEILPYTSIKRILGTNLYIVGDQGMYGIYNSEQNSETLPLHYQQIQTVKDYVMVKKDNMWGVMSFYGKEIIPTKYQMIQLGESHLVIVKRNNRYGVFNILSNSEIISPDFEEIEVIDINLIKYKLNGFWGVMSSKGNEIIPTTRGYTDISYIKGLKKFTYSMHGFKGECNSLGKQLSKIAVANNNATNSGEANARATKTTQGSSNSSHDTYGSSSTSSSSSDNKPNASGTYTISQQGRSLTTGNYTGVAGSDMTVTIEFYDDYITVNGLMCEYAGESNGRKRYDDPMQFAGSSTTYYVDANYNVQKQMTLSTPFGTDWFDYTVVKGNVSIPKAEPYHAPNNNLDGYSTGSSNGNGNRTTKTYQKDCPQCLGSGKCRTCNGTHRDINPLTNRYVTCPNCGTDGRCRACGGTGKK